MVLHIENLKPNYDDFHPQTQQIEGKKLILTFTLTICLGIFLFADWGCGCFGGVLFSTSSRRVGGIFFWPDFLLEFRSFHLAPGDVFKE